MLRVARTGKEQVNAGAEFHIPWPNFVELWHKRLARQFPYRLLVDEGGAKGVRKLGLLSRVPGQTLLLGPLLPERPRCAAVCVSVGYLHSWRTEQGALRLECDIGCSCAPRFLQVDTQARHGVKGERSANEVAHNPL